MRKSIRANRTSLLVVLFATALTLAVFVPLSMSAADAQTPPATRPSTRPARGPDGGLHGQMEGMGKAYRQLKGQIADASKNESSLQLIQQMQQLTLAAKVEIPRRVSRLPAEDQAKSTSSYRNMMVNLLKQELDVEEQLLAGDNTKAAATLAAMEEVEKTGHTEFKGRGPK